MTDEEAELDCVQDGVLLVRPDLATIVVRGPDGRAWLNGLVTCDLAKKRPGDAAYGLKVQKTGKVEAELWIVLVADDEVWLGVRPERAADLVAQLDRHLVMEDATVEVATEPFTWALALGVRAADAMDLARAAGASGGLTSRGGLPVAVLASPGAEGALLAAVLVGVDPARAATERGFARVRVEHGIGAWGVDFDDANLPQEAALERDAVSFDKGCYLGQEAVYMLEKRGHVKKRLVQLVIEGDVAVGAPIATPEGDEVGHVTSAAPRPGRSLALGWVKYKQAFEDTELTVGGHKALVTALLAVRPSE